MAFDFVSLLAHPSVLITVLVWSLSWKGIALWESARRNEGKWFVALLVVNTLGALEIFYLVTRKNKNPVKRLLKKLKF